MRLFANELIEREEEVLAMLTLGKTNKQIAADLCLSPFTVKGYCQEIFHVLGVANRTEASRVYFERKQQG